LAAGAPRGEINRWRSEGDDYLTIITGNPLQLVCWATERYMETDNYKRQMQTYRDGEIKRD